MPYTKQTWNDNDPTTPLSASRLAYLETGVQQAQATADVQKALGPNWVAASNAPSTLKNAISAAGGFLCSGSGDQTQVNAALAAFKTVFLTEGTFTLSDTVTLTQQGSIIGSGYGTKITGTSSLAKPFFTVTTDRVRLTQMYLDGTGIASTSCHGIQVNPTVSTGFIITTEAGIALDNLFIKTMPGDGIQYTGSLAGGGQVARVYIYGCGGRGFYTSSVEGSLNQLHVENCTGNGVMFDTGSADWRVSNVKAAGNTIDGFLINGSRHNLVNVEAQDNKQAGFRFIGTQCSLTGFTADSNGQTNTGKHCGVEVGLNTNNSTGATTATGGTGISISGGQAWDRNPAGTRTQRSGIRVRSSVAGLTLVGVDTGDPAGSLFNATNGIEFLTATDVTATTNMVSAISHRVRVSSV